MAICLVSFGSVYFAQVDRQNAPHVCSAHQNKHHLQQTNLHSLGLVHFYVCRTSCDFICVLFIFVCSLARFKQKKTRRNAEVKHTWIINPICIFTHAKVHLTAGMTCLPTHSHQPTRTRAHGPCLGSCWFRIWPLYIYMCGKRNQNFPAMTGME